jgi:hypothetical protein
MAEPTGLEPATSDVTGRRSNQLNYDSAFSKTKISFFESKDQNLEDPQTQNPGISNSPRVSELYNLILQLQILLVV